ncbi:MAG: site-specific DNA-methyltransferase, partial [SAR324 cluster bacterium]|nr:site-specific DNA-methyltransferase [SAR324 cluster bacterium]
MPEKPKKKTLKTVETIKHDEATRKNIPTAEYQSVMDKKEQNPIRIAYERRNRDLDPQLVWRGKDEQDWSDLIVQAPPLYIQEKVHPKVLIDDLLNHSKKDNSTEDEQVDLFSDFNGLPDDNARTEFYQHDGNWSNRMILGDSLQVMASLAEREGLRGKVQCIYIDPPYGIKFNSNFQWSTTSRDVKDGNAGHITREPEQVKAFRDTWRDGIHSYLTYLRDRLTIARDLLTESGSVFIQIGEENVQRIRSLMDEIFGEENFISSIVFLTTGGRQGNYLDGVADNILWYGKNRTNLKYRQLYKGKTAGGEQGEKYTYAQIEDGRFCNVNSLTEEELQGTYKVFAIGDTTSQGETPSGRYKFEFGAGAFLPGKGRHWSCTHSGMKRVSNTDRFIATGQRLMYKRFIDDYPVVPIVNVWMDTGSGASRSDPKRYIVQTRPIVIERCIQMTTDPGDLVFDPTCGSGTTAYVAEKWGRCWITIDTSRVALALARSRIMGARYPYYLLADSREGKIKEASLSRTVPSEAPTHNDIRHGFVYDRVPHITLKAIANNSEIEVIWEKYQEELEPLREKLNSILGKSWEEWEVPREAEEVWSKEAKTSHEQWWKQRIAR